MEEEAKQDYITISWTKRSKHLRAKDDLNTRWILVLIDTTSITIVANMKREEIDNHHQLTTSDASNIPCKILTTKIDRRGHSRGVKSVVVRIHKLQVVIRESNLR